MAALLFAGCGHDSIKYKRAPFMGWDSDLISGPVQSAEYSMVVITDDGTENPRINVSCWFDSEGRIVKIKEIDPGSGFEINTVQTYEGDVCTNATFDDGTGDVLTETFIKEEGNRRIFERGSQNDDVKMIVEYIYTDDYYDVFMDGIRSHREYFNEKGQVTRHEDYDVDELMSVKTYEYNSDFLQISADGPDAIVYSYENYDDHGNWTLCRMHDRRSDITSLIRRTLTY